jgi:hypothetical protein
MNALQSNLYLNKWRENRQDDKKLQLKPFSASVKSTEFKSFS